MSGPGAITADAIAGFAEIILFELSDTGGTDQGARAAAIRAAERIIAAAEQVWPHDPPKRDPASTTNLVTDRSWTQARRARGTRSGFGKDVSL